jgi:RNA-binding protein
MDENQDQSPLQPALKPSERKALKALAHHLRPVVMIGEAGLSDAVLAETQRALAAHELIKIRVLGDERAGRSTYLDEICRRLGCAPVQQIGKMLVVWRPRPEVDENAVGKSKRPKRLIPKKRLEARSEERLAARRGGIKRPLVARAGPRKSPATASVAAQSAPVESTHAPSRPRPIPRLKPVGFDRVDIESKPTPGAVKPPSKPTRSAVGSAPAKPVRTHSRNTASATPGAAVVKHSVARPVSLSKLRPAGSSRKVPGRT